MTRLCAVAAPLLLLTYGILRWIDGLDGTHGNGPARGAGHTAGFARLGLGGVKAAKLGYAIHADHWGHGYATDAARTLASFGFADLGLHRITAAIGPDSAASIAVATRIGMRHEGRLRDHVFTDKAWRDSLRYSILSTDGPG